MTSTTAPFSLVDEMHGLYRLRSKARISDQNFVYTNADNEQMLFYSELHGSTQEALGFSPGSDLTVNECRLDQTNLAGFREIGDYLSSNSVPYYIFSVVKDKFDVLVGGHNPLNGTTLWQH